MSRSGLRRPETEQPAEDASGALLEHIGDERPSDEHDPGGDLPAELTLDVVFGLLSVERRRQTLTDLRRIDDETTLSEMATRIAALENDVPERAVTSDQRKRVYIALYQSHLPKLADAGVIEYDEARGTIEIDSNAAALYPYLDLGREMAGEEPEDSPTLRSRLARRLPGTGSD